MGKRRQQRKKSLSVARAALIDTRESTQGSSRNCDTSSEQPPVRSAVTQAQEAVLLRALLELVVVQLAAAGDEEPRMAPLPPPPTIPTSQQGTGLSKLMSPVQDLGRSLLSFLVGTSTPSPSTSPPLPIEPEPAPAPPVKRAPSKRDSLSSNTSKRNSLVPNSGVVASPGRQRPPGHPAHPVATSQTPAAVRRLGGAQKSQEFPIPPYKDVPLSPPPPPSDDLILPSGSKEFSTTQPPVANRARRKKVKKGKKELAESQPASQSQNLLEKAPDFPLQRVLCAEGEHQLCPPDANCESSQNADTDVGQGWATARNSVCDPPDIPDSEDTMRQEQGEKGHPAPEVAAVPPVAEEHTSEHATGAGGQDSLSVSADQLTWGDAELPSSEIKSPEEGVSPHLVSSPSAPIVTSTPALQEPAIQSEKISVPIPPPPPPDGYLLEGLKSPPVSRAAEVVKGGVGGGPLKRNTRLTREEALLSQLSVLDDSFSSFLRTQLNITCAPRERDSVTELSDASTTLRRKKERRRRTDSENSDSHATGRSKVETAQENIIEAIEVKDTNVTQCGQDGVPKRVITPDPNGRSSGNALEAATKTGRDRPISFADISEGLEAVVLQEGNKSSDKEADEQRTDAVENSIVGTKVEEKEKSQVKKTIDQGAARADTNFDSAIMAPTVAENLVHQEKMNAQSEVTVVKDSNKLDKEKKSSSDETVIGVPQPAPLTNSIEKEDIPMKSQKTASGVIEKSRKEGNEKLEMEARKIKGLERENQEAKIETQNCVKQELSKSDSGYSGHISCGEEESLPAVRKELNVEQAMRRFHKRLVPKDATAGTTAVRKRTDTEGTSATEDSDDSEDEDYKPIGRRGHIQLSTCT